jgi:hypothetical protein
MILGILTKISDHGDVLISKLIHHVGVSFGIVGGAATYTASKVVSPVGVSPLTLFVLEWGGIISMVAAATLIIKNITDIIINTLRAKWDRDERAEKARKAIIPVDDEIIK